MPVDVSARKAALLDRARREWGQWVEDGDEPSEPTFAAGGGDAAAGARGSPPGDAARSPAAAAAHRAPALPDAAAAEGDGAPAELADDASEDASLPPEGTEGFTAARSFLHFADTLAESSGLAEEERAKAAAAAVAAAEAAAAAAAAAPRRPASRAARAYSAFLAKLKQPACAELVKTLRGFVLSFSAPTSEEEADAMGRSVHACVQKVLTQMREHEVWRAASEAEWEATAEGLEKFIMVKVHSRSFAPRVADRERDVQLRRALGRLAFIQHKHLDISDDAPELAPRWQAAAEELRKMNNYKAPRDKMVCILNCCKLITALLTAARAADKPPGADEFLPALIYTLIKSNPPALHSNLQFIQQFRAPAKLLSEPGYFFTHLLSATAFAETIEASQLTISEDEFAAGVAKSEADMQAARAAKSAAMAAAREQAAAKAKAEAEAAAAADAAASAAAASEDGSESKAASSVAAMTAAAEAATAEAIAAAATSVRPPSLAAMPPPSVFPPLHSTATAEWALWKAYRYRFLKHSSDDLRVADVPPLLKEYKVLVAACEKMMAQRRRLLAELPPDVAARLLADSAPPSAAPPAAARK